MGGETRPSRFPSRPTRGRPGRDRDLSSLTSRFSRKLLAYTVSIYLNTHAGKDPMRFDKLIVA